MSVFGCAICLYPAIPGWAVRCGFVCLGSDFGPALPFLAGVLACVCLCARCACTPANLCSGLWCVCLGSGVGFQPAIPGSCLCGIFLVGRFVSVRARNILRSVVRNGWGLLNLTYTQMLNLGT